MVTASLRYNSLQEWLLVNMDQYSPLQLSMSLRKHRREKSQPRMKVALEHLGLRE